jgi:hypothetical protein
MKKFAVALAAVACLTVALGPRTLQAQVRAGGATPQMMTPVVCTWHCYWSTGSDGSASGYACYEAFDGVQQFEGCAADGIWREPYGCAMKLCGEDEAVLGPDGSHVGEARLCDNAPESARRLVTAASLHKAQQSESFGPAYIGRDDATAKGMQ